MRSMRIPWVLFVLVAFWGLNGYAAEDAEKPEETIQIPRIFDDIQDACEPQAADLEERHIRALVEKLDSEDFEVREQATKDLILLGPAIVPWIDSQKEKETGQEVMARLQVIRRTFYLVILKKAIKEYRSLISAVVKDIASGKPVEQVLAKAELAMNAVENWVGAEDRERVLGALHLETGMDFYKMFTQTDSKRQLLQMVQKELRHSIAHWEKHLAAQPNDRDAEDKLTEAKMIEYATVKYAERR